MVRVVVMDSPLPDLNTIVCRKLGANFLVMHESAIHHVCVFAPISGMVNILDALVKLRSDCVITRCKVSCL